MSDFESESLARASNEIRELEGQLIDMSDQLGEARAVVTDLQDQVDRLERHSRALEQAYTEQGSRLAKFNALTNPAIREQGIVNQKIQRALRLLDELNLVGTRDENQLSAAIDILKGACGQ